MLKPVHDNTADTEIKRRQDLVLEVMKLHNIDAIVMYNYGDMLGGVFKWLTDLTGYYPLGAIMCSSCVATFASGPEMEDDEEPELQNLGTQLPRRSWTCPYLPGITYNNYRYAAAMCNFIKKSGFKRIGWGGLSFIPATIYSYLIEQLPDVDFEDFTERLDEVRLVKSPHEIERYERCVDLHDKLMRYCEIAIRPNITVHMLDNAIMIKGLELGAIEFNTQRIVAWRGSRKLGVHEQLMTGDYIFVLIEVATSSGEWGECARLFRLGEEPEEKWVKIAEKVAEIQHAVAKKCVPGAIPEEIFEYCKELQAKVGFEPEKRLCIHGQGYDIVDLPLFTRGDRTVLKENMFIAIHPEYVGEDGVFGYTDNFLVKKDGAVILSKTPQKIITVSI